MKAKRLIAFALALIMALGCMGFTAFAEDEAIVVTSSMTGDDLTWTSGTYVVTEDTAISQMISVSGNVTLILNANLTVTTSGDYPAVYVNDSTLTITGSGTLSATGGYSQTDWQKGSEGIFLDGGTLLVDGATIIAKGGNGCNGADGAMNSIRPNGGDGSDGGCGIGKASNSVGSLVVKSGNIQVYGGKGGKGGNPGTPRFSLEPAKPGNPGSDGKAINVTTATITGGFFNVDVSNYLSDGYICVKNNDADTKETYAYKVVSGTYLDLESDNTYPDSKTINQPYTLTQNGETTYVEKTKVKVEWVLPEISASYTEAKTWNPDTMKWDDSKVTSTIEAKTANFTFTNYSSEKVKVQVNFTKSIGDKATLTGDVKVLDTAVGTDENRKVSGEAPSVAYPVELTFKNEEFNSLSADEGTYGTYTAKLIALTKYSLAVTGDNLTADSTNPAQITEYSTVTVKANAAEGYAFTGAGSIDGVNNVGGAKLTNGNKTIELTVKDPTKAATVTFETAEAKKVTFSADADLGTVTFNGNFVQDSSEITSYIPKGYIVAYGTDGAKALITFKNGEKIYNTVTASVAGKNLVVGDTTLTAIGDGDVTITVNRLSYAITASLTNATGATTNANKVKEDGTVTLTFTANTGYALPDTVTVTGATLVSWDKSSGTLVISNPTGAVTVSGDAVLLGFAITTSLQNATAGTSNPATISEGNTATLTFTAANGFLLPTDKKYTSVIEVTGATIDSWTLANNGTEGTLVISNPTAAVNIKLVGGTKPVITSQPTSVTKESSDNTAAVLSVTASGSNLTYQWMMDGPYTSSSSVSPQGSTPNWGNRTEDTQSSMQFEGAYGATYYFKCVITNPYGSIESSVVYVYKVD